MKNINGLKANKNVFMIITLYLILVVSILILPGMISAALSIFIVAIIAGFGICRTSKDKGTATLILALPIIMSCLQNIYLGLGANKQTSMSMQILLSSHFLLLIIFFFFNVKKIQHSDGITLSLIIVVLVYSAFLYIAYPSNAVAYVSSIRNIISCMLFFSFATILSRKCSIQKYYLLINCIAWFVILFGIIEYFGGLKIWQTIGITRLWELKGIDTNSYGIPPNWYSSESIGGNVLRRMVSSFADPVNLGTFLFAVLIIAWYQKKRALLIVTLICAILTVSKGALLGVLIFIIIYTFLKRNTRILIPVVGVCVLGVGLLFVFFSANSSTGSLFAHVNGFLSAFDVITTNPLGLGLGNVGVLAGLFNSSLLNQSVSETGFGMIIAQLGIVGLIIFIVFFVHLIRLGKESLRNDKRKKIVYYSLLLGFIANAMFNEVALSPNSCGIYFIQLSIMVNSSKGTIVEE